MAYVSLDLTQASSIFLLVRMYTLVSVSTFLNLLNLFVAVTIRFSVKHFTSLDDITWPR